MKQVIVERYGDPQVMRVEEVPTPVPGAGQVRIRVTSIGMNHADLMARRGEYKILTGDPPFTPGLECGGVIDAVGPGVTDRQVGQRVTVGLDGRRRGPGASGGGTYRSHYICESASAVFVPDAVPDEQLGALWLAYLTSWGCLVWKQDLQPGQTVAIPAASSSVGLAAAQLVKQLGGTAIGLTSSPQKVARIRALPQCAFDHLIVTHRDGHLLPFHEQLAELTGKRGVNVFFDPVAAGEYFNQELRSLAEAGTIWIYGLLGKPEVVNLQVLIRKRGAIRGWVLAELAAAGPAAFEPGYRHVLDGFSRGIYHQHIGGIFRLDDVREAHRTMERGEHLGKLLLAP